MSESKVKSVVKVMNFHALVRVDKAMRNAEKYFVMEQKLRHMIDSITNNMNLVLDKYVLVISKDMPVLNVYIGSDMGFCGGYNFTVNEAALKDDKSKKIVIGKRLWEKLDNVVMRVNKNDYMNDSSKVDAFLEEAIVKGLYSEINICYNEYVNISTIKWTKKRLYPFEFNQEKQNTYYEDFVCESDINDLLRKMVSTYVCFEVMINTINSYASENIMRQGSTSESLKKIDEIEEESYLTERRERSTKQFQSVIESYTKFKYAENK